MLNMKDIPLEERPRERFLKYGAEYLSNEELLAILIKSGTVNYSSKEIALLILKEYQTIGNLKQMSLETLKHFKGIGTTKAIELISAIELGRRIFLEEKTPLKNRYHNAEEIYLANRSLFYDKQQEFFYCLYFNTKQELIERKLLFMGTINRSVVHPREVFKEAYLCSASSIVCMHNHPSGDPKPSVEDIRLTRALSEIGKVNGIPVLDHIIVTDHGYYSFYEEKNIFNQ